MYLIKVTDEIKTELNLIRETLSRREGKEVSYNYVIKEILKTYEDYSQLIRK